MITKFSKYNELLFENINIENAKRLDKFPKIIYHGTATSDLTLENLVIMLSPFIFS